MNTTNYILKKYTTLFPVETFQNSFDDIYVSNTYVSYVFTYNILYYLYRSFRGALN